MSKVYFTNMSTAIDDSLLKKLRRLILAAAMEELGFKGKSTAIKMHFGEPCNLAFLRPNFALVPLEGTDLVKIAKIGHAVADALVMLRA